MKQICQNAKCGKEFEAPVSGYWGLKNTARYCGDKCRLENGKAKAKVARDRKQGQRRRATA